MNYDIQVVTLPGSSCAIQLGIGLTDAPPGSARTTYLVVNDLEAAYRELSERGVPVCAIAHKPSIGDWKGDWAPGVDPHHRDYASIATFADPDGNTWTLQEIGFQPT